MGSPCLDASSPHQRGHHLIQREHGRQRFFLPLAQQAGALSARETRSRTEQAKNIIITANNRPSGQCGTSFAEVLSQRSQTSAEVLLSALSA